MSIEKLLGELIDAINENTETHKKVLSTLNGAKAGKTSKPAEEKEEAEEKTTRSTTKKPADKKASAKGKKPPSEDELREAFGDFLSTDDEDEKKERKSYIATKILKKFKVAKVTELAAEDRAEAIALLEGFEPEESEDDDDIL